MHMSLPRVGSWTTIAAIVSGIMTLTLKDLNVAAEGIAMKATRPCIPERRKFVTTEYRMIATTAIPRTLIAIIHPAMMIRLVLVRETTNSVVQAERQRMCVDIL